MKTTSSLYFSAILALFIAAIFVGCDSPGPLTRAVTLSGLKTFDVVQKEGVDSSIPPRALPSNDVLMDTVRDEALSKGYQLQAAAPDFVISVGWVWSQQMVQVTPPGPPVAPVDMVMLSIIVKDARTNEVLWRNPGGFGPMEARSVTTEEARVTVRKAMKDFPPQTAH